MLLHNLLLFNFLATQRGMEDLCRDMRSVWPNPVGGDLTHLAVEEHLSQDVHPVQVETWPSLDAERSEHL